MPKPVRSLAAKSVLAGIIVIIILIVIFFGGFYLGKSGSVSINQTVQPTLVNAPAVNAPVKGTYQEGYQSGLDFARKKLQAKAMFFALGQSHNISNATVKSVSGNELVIEFDSSLLDIFSEGMTTKTVKISENTKIENHIQKSPDEMRKGSEEYRKNRQEYQAASQAGGEAMALPTPPLPYNIEILKLSDIRAGDIISVASDADITKSDTFEATSIILIPAPEVPKNLNELPVNTAPEATAPASETTTGNVPAQPKIPSADTSVAPPKIN